MKKLPLTFDSCRACPYSINDVDTFLRGMYVCKLTGKTFGIGLIDLSISFDSCPLEDVEKEKND